jgi:hypothetical protein
MMEDVQGRMRSGSTPGGTSTESGSSSSVSVETRCCVNGQFLDCPVSECSGLGQCLMDCMDSSSSGCEQSCFSKYTSSCKRVPSRNAECAK